MRSTGVSDKEVQDLDARWDAAEKELFDSLKASDAKTAAKQLGLTGKARKEFMADWTLLALLYRNGKLSRKGKAG